MIAQRVTLNTKDLASKLRMSEKDVRAQLKNGISAKVPSLGVQKMGRGDHYSVDVAQMGALMNAFVRRTTTKKARGYASRLQQLESRFNKLVEALGVKPEQL